MPTVEYAVCLFIYLFIGLSGSTVQLTIVQATELIYSMPGMQRVVYVKSSKVLAAISYCLLLIPCIE